MVKKKIFIDEITEERRDKKDKKRRETEAEMRTNSYIWGTADSSVWLELRHVEGWRDRQGLSALLR